MSDQIRGARRSAEAQLDDRILELLRAKPGSTTTGVRLDLPARYTGELVRRSLRRLVDRGAVVPHEEQRDHGTVTCFSLAEASHG
jgi:hypothetical protein